MHNLSRYACEIPQSHYVKGQVQVTDDYLTIDFEVEFTGPVNCSSQFAKDTFENWGLWEFDVVEVFLTREDQKLPYLELQLSPLGQCFALVVNDPRKDFLYPDKLDLQVTSEVVDNLWTSTLKINLSDIPGSGDIIWGNLHSCLGPKEERQYFALNLSDRIDFHRPEYFIELGRLR